MHSRYRFSWLALGAVMLLPRSAGAQAIERPRVHLSINAAWQIRAIEVAEEFEFEESLEKGQFRTTYRTPAGPLFDVGGIVRIGGIIGAGAAIEVSNRKSEADVFFSVPHPLRFRANRTFESTLDANRREIALHVQGALFLRLGDRLSVIASGGPSFFRLRQDVVEGVNYLEVFPFNSLRNPSVVVQSVSETGVGFHVGADAAWMLGRWLGVGGLVRYSRATIEVPLPERRGQERTLSARLGGVSVGGGLRLAF